MEHCLYQPDVQMGGGEAQFVMIETILAHQIAAVCDVQEHEVQHAGRVERIDVATAKPEFDLLHAGSLSMDVLGWLSGNPPEPYDEAGRNLQLDAKHQELSPEALITCRYTHRTATTHL